ncbi:hypothetical protein P0M11_08850 [Kaistella sp. PBT33-4]|uniref:hypothetical protein n=1 Tax=Kaistella sp. PBT33-4 TaxID=3032000 RepID=UPI0023D7EF87|nr:hypothetical protein [Kaistella sp. PBT33-4]MDF0720106.1 hypothetical protein [Kaistella sp. PBT33-4]
MIKILNYLLLLLIILGCSKKNKIIKDDYEIMQYLVNENIAPSTSQYLNDSIFAGFHDKESAEFKKKYNSTKNVYSSKYYYTLSDTLFAYESNGFLNYFFAIEGFNTIPSKSKFPPVKLDLNKITSYRNLIRIKKNSPLKKDKNFIGDYKMSRIIYQGNKAIVLWFDNDDKGVYIMKKENGRWIEDYGRGIPVRYNNEDIVF